MVDITRPFPLTCVRWRPTGWQTVVLWTFSVEDSTADIPVSWKVPLSTPSPSSLQTEIFQIISIILPSALTKVSGCCIATAYTWAEVTGRPSFRTCSFLRLMISAICSVRRPPFRSARTYSMASSIFISRVWMRWSRTPPSRRYSRQRHPGQAFRPASCSSRSLRMPGPCSGSVP